MNNFARQGVILKNNNNEAVEIYTKDFEASGKDTAEMYANNIKKLIKKEKPEVVHLRKHWLT